MGKRVLLLWMELMTWQHCCCCCDSSNNNNNKPTRCTKKINEQEVKQEHRHNEALVIYFVFETLVIEVILGSVKVLIDIIILRYSQTISYSGNVVETHSDV